MKAIIAILIILSLGAASCTPTDPSSAIDPGKRMKESALIAIRSQIAADPRMTGTKVEVTGDRDSVVLDGAVATAEQKKIAEELVEKYDPDLHVKNNLSVAAQGGGGDTPLSY